MKFAFYTFICAFLLFYNNQIKAQSISNTSFENWHEIPNAFGKEDPDGWMSTNGPTGFFGIHGVAKSTDAKTGDKALKLISIPVEYPEFAVAICNGKPKVNFAAYSLDLMSGGEPVSGKPEKLTGFYKYSADTSRDDSAYAFVILKKQNQGKRDTVGYGAITFTESANYKAFEIPITYKGTADPDSVIVAFVFATEHSTEMPSSKSVLLIDGISLSGKLTGIAPVSSPSKLKVFPNPSKGLLWLDVEGNADIMVMDITGKTVLSLNNISAQQPLDVSSLPYGVYMVQVMQDGNVLRERFVRE